MHPRQAKAALAAAIVRRYHGEEAARMAAEEFARVFRDRELPGEMPQLFVPAGELKAGRMGVGKLLKLAGGASASSEARRLVEQGGVSLGASAESLQAVGDSNAELQVQDGMVLKVGKKRFFRLRRQALGRGC